MSSTMRMRMSDHQRKKALLAPRTNVATTLQPDIAGRWRDAELLLPPLDVTLPPSVAFRCALSVSNSANAWSVFVVCRQWNVVISHSSCVLNRRGTVQLTVRSCTNGAAVCPVMKDPKSNSEYTLRKNESPSRKSSAEDGMSMTHHQYSPTYTHRWCLDPETP